MSPLRIRGAVHSIFSVSMPKDSNMEKCPSSSKTVAWLCGKHSIFINSAVEKIRIGGGRVSTRKARMCSHLRMKMAEKDLV